MSWEKLGCSLAPEIKECISKLGFEKPTPVQSATIPLFVQNKDVVVEAVTGSGKTLAFLIPVIEMLKKRKNLFKPCEIGAVIVSPTRELAKQIADALTPFQESGVPLKKFVFTGGTGDAQADANRFRSEGGNVIIGTPGRLEDMFNKYPELMATKSVEVLVLDEADRLLDMGFERSLNFIISKLPKQRRTGLFSATMTNAVNELIRAGLRNPVKVTVKVESKQAEQKIPESLTVYSHLCPYEQRLAFLLDYLKEHHRKKTMVYFGTCACVDYFSKALPALKGPADGLKILGLHGKMEHKRRNNLYKEFVESPSAVLFCTDLAARGLDFPDIDLVIQFDAPQDPAAFVHRCGRTARSGREGTALVLLDPQEEAYVDFMEGRKIPLHRLPEFQPKTQAGNLLKCLIQLNSSDREYYEKSLRAFVSHMRFYQEHQAKFIFCFKELDVGGLARSFGLLHLPKMPELAQFKTLNFSKTNIDVSTIKFKDKTREKQRQVSLARRAEQQAVERPAKRQSNQAWSEQNARKDRRVERKEKKLRKKEAIAKARTAESDVSEEDEDDLEDDYRSLKKEKRLMKKVKSGQMNASDLEDSDIDSD